MEQKSKEKLKKIAEELKTKRVEAYLPGQKDNLVNIEEEVFDPRTFEGKGKFAPIFKEIKEKVDEEQNYINKLVDDSINETKNAIN